MRDLTKKEKKQFDIFIKGYIEGLKGVPVSVRVKYHIRNEILSPNEVRTVLEEKGIKYMKNDVISPVPANDDILESYKDKVRFWKRSKVALKEYKQGYIDGYFRALSSEQPRAFLDPELNEDIYKYLQSTWLYEHEYGGGSDAGSESV